MTQKLTDLLQRNEIEFTTVVDNGRTFYKQEGTYTHFNQDTKRKYLFNYKDVEQLLLLCAESNHCIAENRKGFNGVQSSLYFDMDLKTLYSEKKDRLYDDDFLKFVISCITTSLVEKYKVKLPEKDLIVCVLEKQPYKSISGATEYWKNGFHLQFPRFIVQINDFVKLVLPTINEKIIAKYPDHPYMNLKQPLDNCYTNPWLLYNGAKKKTSQPYKLTKIFDCNFKEMTKLQVFNDYEIFDFEENPIELNTEDEIDKHLPHIFSLMHFGRSKYEQELKNEVVFKGQENELEKKRKRDENRQKFKDDNIPLSKKSEDVKKYLSLITERDEYKTWYTVGQAIYNIGIPDGLQLFLEWSSDANNFDEDACEKLYNGLKTTNSGMGTLRYLAKEFSPAEYRTLQHPKQDVQFIENDLMQINELYDEFNGFTHHHFATIYKNANRDDIIFTTGYGYIIFDETKRIWSFNNTKNKLIYPLCQFFTTIMSRFQEYKRCEFANEEDEKLKARKCKVLSDVIANCGSTTFMNGVIAQLEGILTKPNEFVDVFDAKAHLFAFNDGTCIDMTNGLRRTIEKDDYIMTTCGYAYPERNEDLIKEANSILWSLTENEEQDRSLKTLMSLGFYGKNKNELFLQMTGSGGNGKGLCATIMNNVYGRYYKEISPDQLTEYDKDKGRANSELADCRFARIVMTTEPKDGKDATLKTPMLKRWTGNDKIQARYLHKDAFEYTPKFTLMMQLNDPLDLSTCDEAIKRRLRVLELEFSFVDDNGQELQPNQRKKETTLKNKISQQEFVDAFCHILIDTYIKENGRFYESEKIKSKTTEFFDTQNPVKQWFMENYIVCEDIYDSYIFGNELYNKFRDDYPNKHLSNTAFGRLLKEICKSKRITKGVVYYCKRQILPLQQKNSSHPSDLL